MLVMTASLTARTLRLLGRADRLEAVFRPAATRWTCTGRGDGPQRVLARVVQGYSLVDSKHAQQPAGEASLRPAQHDLLSGGVVLDDGSEDGRVDELGRAEVDHDGRPGSTLDMVEGSVQRGARGEFVFTVQHDEPQVVVEVL